MFFVDKELALVLVQLFPTLLIALAVEARTKPRRATNRIVRGMDKVEGAIRLIAVISSITATFELVVLINSDKGSGFADWSTTIAFWSMNAAVVIWALSLLAPIGVPTNDSE